MKKICLLSVCLLVIICSTVHLHGEENVIGFSKKPVAISKDGKMTISFTVKEMTDVAVFIEDNKGHIVRHLVAGVLGKNAPEPLAKNSLSQKIIWNGKADYGKPAGKGPFQVRVALGMNAQFEKFVAEQKKSLNGNRGLAVRANGEVLFAGSFGASVPNWSGWTLKSASREGAYRQTIFPPSADFTEKEFKALGITTAKVDDKVIPVYSTIRTRSFIAETLKRRSALAVAPTGEILLAMSNGSIGALQEDGKAAWGRFQSKPLFRVSSRNMSCPFMVVSSDGKSLFVAGWPLGKKGGFAVCKVNLPGRDKVEVFFGDDQKKGTGKNFLGGIAHGLAIDGKGNLFIADHTNGRVVVVSEKSGQYVGELKVEKADGVMVNPKNDNLYVTSNKNGTVDVYKFKNWQEESILVKTRLKRSGSHAFPWIVALDSSGPNPVLWATSDYGKLLRIEERDQKFFVKPMSLGKKEFGNGSFVGLTVSRYQKQKEIFARIGPGKWFRYKEDGDVKGVVKTGTAINQGCCIEVAPDGMIYSPAYPRDLLKFDNKGRPAKFTGADLYPADSKKKPLANGRYVPVAMGFMTHTLGIRHDGHLFVFEQGKPGGRHVKKLMEYLPDGTRLKKDPLIWKVSDVAVGPKFDAQGNIYFAEQIKPLGQLYPDEFKSIVGDVKLDKKNVGWKDKPQGTIVGMYGSILKFGLKGGTIHWDGKKDVNPYEGKAKLDPSLKTVDAAWYSSEKSQYLKPVKVTGALWMKMGISHIERHYCNCESTRFDVDEFGRIFYPDLLRFQIRVMDTNSNDIMHVGNYGNLDSKGVSSNSNTKNIPLAWLVGVAATDKFMYAADSLNRRILQMKITYAVEETVSVK